ncbi:MAG TPA: type IV pilus twitching motility protein PilT [Armatimonadota bacterium]|nr:type IV pilus twitching motility protein PilT [Armatimonadota bacterium]
MTQQAAGPEIDEYLHIASIQDASDIHLKVGRPPLLRIRGDLIPTDLPELEADDVRRILREALPTRFWEAFCDQWELDVAYESGEDGRYRLNAFMQRGTIEVVLRVIPQHMMTMEEIGLPKLARSFATRVRGLVLVTGPVGSGKTTTQAAMIDFINGRYPCHIITVEDPIEYLHENKKALISQRAIGLDTCSFSGALRNALREDPDVVLVGEMRDLETVRMAITAAETGHLVISTLHTMDAAETINRIIDIFPTHQQEQVRMQLAINLVGVIAQTLVKRASGEGRVAAFEVMANVPAVATAIRENKIYQITSVLQSGLKSGMMSLDRSLAQLVKDGIITYEEGVWRAKNPDEYAQLAIRKTESAKGS